MGVSVCACMGVCAPNNGNVKTHYSEIVFHLCIYMLMYCGFSIYHLTYIHSCFQNVSLNGSIVVIVCVSMDVCVYVWYL